MKEVHLFYAPDIEQTQELPTEEAIHAIRVLRLKEGEELLITDGKGTFYDAELSLASQKHCKIKISNAHPEKKLWKRSIHLVVAPTKSIDRIEWLVEKATEIGVDKISFLNCDNSERHIIKSERIEKIVIAAMKQSHKATKPVIEEMMNFDKFIKKPFKGQRFIAHCYLESDISKSTEKPFLGEIVNSEEDTQVLVGPEGDFSIDEVRKAINAGFQSISLGESRLRTETAALVAVHLMYLAKRL